ncbi:MAG: hypothetical protein RTU63_07730 [Candidatus Thorarchaeota archaeon]
MKLPLESIDVATEPQIRLRPRILNDTIGDLFLPQQISLFHGSERAPLSILAHSAIVSAARMGTGSCFFLDSGTNYSSTLVKTLCHSTEESVKVLEKTAVGPVLGLTDVIEKIEMLRDYGEVSLVVIDSLTGALNLTGDPGSRGRQRNLFTALDSIRRVINDIDTHVMITDHSSRNWTSGQSTPIGGNVLAHAVDSVVLVDRLRKGEDVVRILVERCTLHSPPPGVIVKIGTKGIRSIR